MKPRRSVPRALSQRPGTVAIVLLALAWAAIMHTSGWAQTSHFAQVRAVEAGEKTIDRWHWETMDKGWIDGHFYSVKAPGLTFLTVPAYAAIDGAGLDDGLAAAIAAEARTTASPNWEGESVRPWDGFGYEQARAERVEAEIERTTPVVWMLTLVGCVVPAVALLLLVRWVAERLVPGYGTLAAITLGIGTIVMSFASIFSSHVLSATLLFAAFALLLRERDGDRTRLALVGAAGLAAGFSISVEYPLGIGAGVLFAYAVAGRPAPLPRGLAYAAGGLLGVLPALLFNAWTLGSPFEFAYGAAVEVQGYTGHALVGLNSDGLFGITVPKPEAALELLVSSRGLAVLTPVLAAAVAGLALMRRERALRAEWWVIVAMCAAYFVYDAGYWLPFGGGTPGPRFLIPVMPFLALGLAYAYRHLPATTTALAIPSGLLMVVAAITFPLIGEQGTGMWGEMLFAADFEHTVLTALGADGLVSMLPVLLLVAGAIWFAARTAPPLELRERDIRWGFLATGIWLAVAVVGPEIAGDPTTPLERPAILAVAAAGALVSLVTLARFSRRLDRERDPGGSPGSGSGGGEDGERAAAPLRPQPVGAASSS